jgi:hypothetical protein
MKKKTFSPGSYYEPGLKVSESARVALPTWMAFSPGSLATGTKEGCGALVLLCW